MKLRNRTKVTKTTKSVDTLISLRQRMRWARVRGDHALAATLEATIATIKAEQERIERLVRQLN